MSNIIHSIDSQGSAKKTSTGTLIIVIVITALLGIGTGYLLKSGKSGGATTTTTTGSKETVKETAGILDEKTFPDSVEGMLKEGGVEDEGSHHLERPGGQSQNVYLTSSTVDLSEFEGKKIRVRGKTFQGQKAGWLMDVGYVEVLQ